MDEIWNGEVFEIHYSPDVFKLAATIPKEEWAPGVWAGMEELEMVVTKVDLETRTITLEVKK